MAIASRQFTLRNLMVFTGIIGVGCGLAMAGDMTTVKGTVMLGAAWRILAIASLSAVIGFAIGSIRRVAIAVTTGVLLVDLGLLALHLLRRAPDPWSPVYMKDFLGVWCINPCAVLALIICPGVAVKNRKLALILGISLSFAVPTPAFLSVAMYFYRGPMNDWGNHYFHIAVLSKLALGLGFLGVLGTFVVRAVVEKWERGTGTKIGESEET